MTGPDPDALHPMQGVARVKFLKPLAQGRTNVSVGDYSYYDDPDDTADFFDRNVLHHYDFIGDRLEIGPFVVIAAAVRIMMNGGTHAMDGFPTFSFNIFGAGCEIGFDPGTWKAVNKGDTAIGADVWIGTEAMLMPGVTVSPGAVVAARSVVTGDVAPYAVVGSNPARELRRRFDGATVAAHLDMAWWTWSPARIAEHLDAIRSADLAALRRAAA